MGLKIEVPIFTQTNLGTNIVISVSPDITAGEFKRKLERAHIDSFHELGELTSIAVMVKQKSNFYRLPDFLPIKHAFQGCEKVWFVHVDVCPLDKLEILSAQESLVPVRRKSRLHFNDHIKLKQNDAKIIHKEAKLRGIRFLNAVMHGFTSATYMTRKKKKRKRRHIPMKVCKGDNTRVKEEYIVSHKQIPDAHNGDQNDPKEALEPTHLRGSNDMAEAPCESLSGAASVSGIIDRYFSNLFELDQIDSDEVAMRAGENQLKKQEDDASPRMSMTTKRHSICETNQILLPSPLPKDSSSVGLRNKYERSEVGNRLVVASNNLQRHQSEQKSSKSNLSKGKKFLETVVGSTVRGLVFEIGDDD